MHEPRTGIERRVLNARKINQRRRRCKKIWYLNYYAEQESGKFCERLCYSANYRWFEKAYYKKHSDRRNEEALNQRMEDYNNEGLCEL